MLDKYGSSRYVYVCVVNRMSIRYSIKNVTSKNTRNKFIYLFRKCLTTNIIMLETYACSRNVFVCTVNRKIMLFNKAII